MSTEERGSLYIILKSLFKEVLKESSLVGKVSLISLAQQLSSAVRSENYTLKELTYSFYWFSFLVYWKAEWLFNSSFQRAKNKDNNSKNSFSKQKSNKLNSFEREVKSLVLYLEHKTFKSLALDRREPKTKITPLRQEHLKEIYSNLKKEKEKKERLSHIEIQEPILSSFLAVWEPILGDWKEEISFNETTSFFSSQEKTLAFIDILQRKKKGDLEIYQEGVKEDIFLRKLKKEILKSYG